MGLPIPNLDDKTFDQFVEEARLLIPRFSPEWTDHNLSDPGITFIDLFAWLAEMQIYQLNRITDANYQKYLRMVGIQQWEARPAGVDVTFDNVTNVKRVKAGTRLVTEVDTERIVFEISKNYTLIPVSIISVKTRYNSQTIDNSDADKEDDIYYHAFGEKASKDSELHLGLGINEDKKILSGHEVQITFILYEKGLQAVGSHGDEPEQVVPSVELEWKYYDGRKWNVIPEEKVKDSTSALTKSGNVVFEWPSDINKKEDGLYWILCRVKEGNYEITPLVDKILLNTISAQQINAVKNETLEGGRWLPGQKITVKKPEKSFIIKESQEISVQRESGQWEKWLEVDNLESSGPEDPHYIFDSEKGEITFGNGLNGRIPISSQRIQSSYTTTRGAKSNIPKGNSFSFDGIHGINLKEAIGGRDIETIEHARDRARKDFKKRYRAINSNDYEKLALSTPGLRVAKAKAIPNYSPVYSNIRIPGTVTVVVVPFTRPKNWNESSAPRTITDYDGSRKVIVVDTSWEIVPDTAYRYQIYTQHDGIAQGGTDSTITLSNTASDNNGVYNGLQIRIIRGKGICQPPRTITAYDGNTKIATVTPKWGQTPDDTSEYQIGSLQGISQGSSRQTITLETNASGVDDAYNGFLIEIDDKVTPTTGKGFIRTVENHLNRHRLITTDLYVIGPNYVKISVKCKVHIKWKSSPEETKNRVREAIDEFIDPLQGGPDGKGWSLGRSVFPSEIYQLIDKQEGVNYVTDVFLYATGQYRKKGETITIPPNGLIYPGSHRIEIE